MLIENREYTMPDGRTVTVRSTCAADTAAVLEQMCRTSAETYFMIRTADEVRQIPLEEEERKLAALNASPLDAFIVAEHAGHIIGSAGISPIRVRQRTLHRASFGISIEADFCSGGLGSFMLQTLIDAARRIGYSQIELGVYSDNPRAIRCYEKAGFTAWGASPRAFRLEDGTYRDEVQMTLMLK